MINLREIHKCWYNLQILPDTFTLINSMTLEVSTWERCKNQTSRPSQVRVNGGAVSK